jgi:hypothetical protein
MKRWARPSLPTLMRTLLAFLLLSACPAITDADGDGHAAEDDCDDDNPALPNSEAEALRDQVGTDNIGGDILIEDNGPN